MSPLMLAAHDQADTFLGTPAISVAARRFAPAQDDSTQAGHDLLIGQTLKAPTAAATPDFALAVSTWQKQRGLSPNGVLDENSWMALVSQWQADRLKDNQRRNVLESCLQHDFQREHRHRLAGQRRGSRLVFW